MGQREVGCNERIICLGAETKEVNGALQFYGQIDGD